LLFFPDLFCAKRIGFPSIMSIVRAIIGYITISIGEAVNTITKSSNLFIFSIYFKLFKLMF